MAGPAERESLGWSLNLPAADITELKDFHVAIWATDPMAPVAKEVEDRSLQVGAMLERLGAQVSYDARPRFDLEDAMRNYQTLLNSVMTAAWDDQAVAQMQTKAAALDPNDLSLDAVNARAAVLSHRDWIRSNSRREKPATPGRISLTTGTFSSVRKWRRRLFRTIIEPLANGRSW